MDQSQLETSINTLADDFAEAIAGLVTGDWLREGVLKQAVTAVVWSLYGAMPDQRAALAEALENWPDIIKDAVIKDQTNESNPT